MEQRHHHPVDECARLIRRWGGACSAALLDPTTQLFAPRDYDGLVGFRGTSRCRVVFGEPTARPEHVPGLAEAFHRDAARQGSSVVYVGASETFSRWALETGLCKISVPFGEEVMLSTEVSPRERTGTNASLVRRKVRHAAASGVTVFEYLGGDVELERQIEQVAERWRAARKGFQVFISHLHLFSHREGKRWFVALCRGRVVGALVSNRLEAKQGWAFNHLLIDPDAPGGTPESLVVWALETLQGEGSPFVTFGAVQSPSDAQIHGLGPMGRALMQGILRLSAHLLPIQGRRKFLEKFAPAFAPSQLLFSRELIGIRECVGLFKAMNLSLQL